MTDHPYWHRQGDKPLFPDLLWSRPENKQQAGKLLILGGHAYGFAAPAQAYQESIAAGIGSAKVLLPDHIKKQLSHFRGDSLEIEYAPSTPSGSFASKSLAEILDAASWADGILLAGDLGRNSETAIVLEKLLDRTSKPLMITKDAVDYFTTTPDAMLARKEVCLVLSIAQLQKLVKSTQSTTAITFSMDLMHLVDALHDFTITYPVHIIVKHLDTIAVASAGKVCTTPTDKDMEDFWRLPTAATASVWWIQNQTKPFEALATSLIET